MYTQKIKTILSQKITLIIFGFIFTLLSFELFLFFTDIDLRLLRKTLYYQRLYLPFHRVSGDAERLYELVPDAYIKNVGSIHPREIKYKKIDVTINALGFRDKKRDRIKKDGVFRIVIFGGSNTFGAAVSDEDTYPAYMQKIFDKKYPGKVEVWNAGICAYVMSQDVAYAEYVIKNFYPDLLIFQKTNTGRRAFHYNATLKELKELFSKNKELYAENAPLLLHKNTPPIVFKAHYFFASNSRLYRILYIGICSFLGVFSYNNPVPSVDMWGGYGQMVNDRNFDLFTEKHKDIPIVLFYFFGRRNERIKIKENMGCFVFNNIDKPQEYRDIHPPSYVYERYAQELYDFLIQNGFLSFVSD